MRIISGIQPSGELHIGNYLGAIKNWLELQKDSRNECLFFVADYHSLTEAFDSKTKSKEILDLATDLLALGLDPKKSTLFVQSRISEHANLAWIFNTLVKMSELERMTQFKDKAFGQKENVNIALFAYPVLMAADILIYKAQAVPVGEDQVQHLELTRDIAKRFNEKFGKTFPEPKSLFTETPRIMSLIDPTRKMSKSHGPKSYIALLDSPEVLEEKIKSAVSDTGGPPPLGDALRANKHSLYPKGGVDAGGSNLLSIFGAFARTKEEKDEFEKFRKDHNSGKLKYFEFKPKLSRLVSDYFADFREKHAQLAKNRQYVKTVLDEGGRKAESLARATLEEVKKKIGIAF